jgi:DNA-binding response OmpR family regulator
MKILLVENHQAFTSVVVPTFLSEHEVTIVPSCSSARAVFSPGAFDVVLVDYDLDDAKGDTLVRWVSSQRGPPVIAISSHDSGNDALVRAGAIAVCAKLRFDQIGAVLLGISGSAP